MFFIWVTDVDRRRAGTLITWASWSKRDITAYVSTKLEHFSLLGVNVNS